MECRFPRSVWMPKLREGEHRGGIVRDLDEQRLSRIGRRPRGSGRARWASQRVCKPGTGKSSDACSQPPPALPCPDKKSLAAVPRESTISLAAALFQLDQAGRHFGFAP